MRTSYYLRLRLTAFLVSATFLLASQQADAVVLFSEDFEGVQLNPTFTLANELSGREVWSDLATAQGNGSLAGWSDEKNGVLGTLDPANSGVREFWGWTFLDKDWWIDTAGDQDRSAWARGYGTVAVADNDEFDDFSFGPAEDQGLTNDACDPVATGGCYAATIDTPAIDISGQAANSVRFAFDSSWRPEDDGNTPQSARLEVSFDSGPYQELFTYTSDNSNGQRTLITGPLASQLGVADDGSGNFFAADLELANQVVDVPVSNPGGSSTMQVRFNTFDAGNDWWWAVDNLQAYTGPEGSEPRDPALKVVIDRDTNTVTLVNGTPNSIDLRGYEVVSSAGSLNADAASFMDQDALGSTTQTDDWVRLSGSGSGTDLSEGYLDPAGTTIASGASIALGAAWVNYFAAESDISLSYLVAGKSEPVAGLTEVIGDPFPFLDLNFDRMVDINDWVEFLAITDTADLSNLTQAQAYLKGDLDADGRLGVNDFLVFQREFDLINGVGAFEAAIASIPEPASAAIVLTGVFGFVGLARRHTKTITTLVCLVVVAAATSPAMAGRTVDRLYRFGDDDGGDTATIAAADGPLNTKTTTVFQNVQTGPFNDINSFTADSVGAPNSQQLIDLSTTLGSAVSTTVGVPTYTVVTDRPDQSGGASSIAVEFSGISDDSFGFPVVPHLLGSRLGTPSTSISSIGALPTPGTLDYSFIRDRGFQFWTKPTSVPNTMSGDPLDDVHIVMDTNNHGALINSNGNFTMRYNGEDFEGVGTVADAVAGSWYHVMVVRPDVSTGSVMYVNGVAVAVAPGDYQAGVGGNSDPDTAALMIGANTEPLATQTESFNRNGYAGIVDDLEMFVLGFNYDANSGLLNDLGEFDFGSDNLYAAAFGPANPLDLVGGGNGVDLDDVSEFVSNWQFSKEINGSLIGDLETVAKGDFNYDGVVNIGDWELLNSANPVLGLAALQMINAVAVPEPTTLVMVSLALVGAISRRQR